MGPLDQMETFYDSVVSSPPMHYNDWCEAMTLLCILSLVSGQITWQEQLAPPLCWQLHNASEPRTQERDEWDSGHRENLCIRFWLRGGHYASYHSVLRNRWKKVYPKCASRFGVYSELETRLFLICAFLSTCEFLTCRALTVPDLLIPVDGQEGPRTPPPPTAQPFTHWWIRRFHFPY